jgi:Abnormal spindle-like microcephaly-assoc'd, ASPM-SPD-2-Hydin
LVANAAAVGVLSTSDSSLNFGGVQVNGTGTQPETLTNSGGANVTITQAKVSGTGFSVTGLKLPLTLSPGQSFTFGAAFSPASGGNFTGSISVVSDASDANLTITLAGTATVSGQLAVSPATLNFGTVTVGQSKSLTGSLTASGSSITVSNASMSTSEFTISGLALPLTLTAGQSASFTVNFKPQASGTASASGSFNSNASNNSSVVQALSGTGAAAPQHSVALTWNPSSSTVVGYNIYRGTASGGPYSKINSLNADTTYSDSSVQSGQTYFYVTTAVDGSGRESANSNQTQAVIPTP